MRCFEDIVLGQGAFGKVMRAEAVGIIEAEDTTKVAVKMVRGENLLLFVAFYSHSDVDSLTLTFS
jgi:Protein tyrosine and serine/threonine kinase